MKELSQESLGTVHVGTPQSSCRNGQSKQPANLAKFGTIHQFDSSVQVLVLSPCGLLPNDDSSPAPLVVKKEVRNSKDE